LVELGLGVQASSSKPLGFGAVDAAAAAAADELLLESIKLGDGVLAVVLTGELTFNCEDAFANAFSSTLIEADLAGVGLPRLVLSLRTPLGPANKLGAGELGLLVGIGPGGGGGFFPSKRASCTASA
jgi:hypothetical protein